MIKQKLEYILFSNKFYNFFLKPFDKIKYQIVNEDKLKEERIENSVPFNKIPNVSDIYNKEWNNVLLELSPIFSMNRESFHRKIWEFTHTIYILKKSGYLYPKNKGLAIGAGREQILYYLAYKIEKITGIDLFEGNYIGGEDEPDIPKNPQKYAPFIYPEANLDIIKMDALNLKFKDNSFDFIFSASSIEHFGSKKNILKSIKEMYRVLKPGGIAVITTEIKLNRLACNIPNTIIFELNELLTLFKQSGFLLYDNEIDIRIEDYYLNNWVKLPQEVFKSPHVILRFLRSIFTSVAIVFKKPGNSVKKGNCKKNTSFQLFKYKGSIKVRPEKKNFLTHETMVIQVQLKNNSNFDWFSNGMSHRIAIGIKLLNLEDKIIDDAYGEIVIPHNIKIGESIDFKAEIPIKMGPGYYKLFFDLKRELITWFSEKGNKPWLETIEVKK